MFQLSNENLEKWFNHLRSMPHKYLICINLVGGFWCHRVCTVPVLSVSHQRNAKSTPSWFHLELQFNLFSFSCTLKMCMKGRSKCWGRRWSERNPPPVRYCLLWLAITRAFPSRKGKRLWILFEVADNSESVMRLILSLWEHYMLEFSQRVSAVPLNATVWIQNIYLSNC